MTERLADGRRTMSGTVIKPVAFTVTDEDRGFGVYTFTVRTDAGEVVTRTTSSRRVDGAWTGSRIAWTEPVMGEGRIRFIQIDIVTAPAPTRSREERIREALAVCAQMGAPITKAEAARRVDCIDAGQDWTKED